MKIAVRYHSDSGNTKKVAEAVALAVGVKAETTSYPVDDVDLLFIGSPIHAGKLPYEITEFFSEVGPAKVKKVAVFGTSMSGKSPAPLFDGIVRPRGIQMVGESYACPGKYLIFKRGRPNDDDLAAAAEFAKKIAAAIDEK
ncbi:MAG: nitric oxide synthase [Oscillospiraceae bacterium]|jgi:flavodoxin|nr:nitric oxide synthase [Oscillospiraceae bacterium]